MHNPKHSPYAHFKSPLLYDWCMCIEFHPSINIFIQVGLFHKYYFQIHDFIIHLWHLNRIHFAKGSKRDKN
jgi:hypothetical protein